MDGLLVLLFLFWLFKKFAKKGKKKTDIPRREQTMNARNTETEAQRISRIREEIRRMQFEKQLPMQEVASSPPGEGESHMDYTQDAHGCLSAQKEYMGSLLMDSAEGEDACDPALGHEAALYRETKAEPESVYADEIGREPVLNLTARGIWQGVVMSEILNRPSRHTRRI